MKIFMQIGRKIDNFIYDSGKFIWKHRYRLPTLPNWLEFLRKEDRYGSGWLAIIICWIVICVVFSISTLVNLSVFVLLLYLNMIDNRSFALCFKKPNYK